SYRVYSVGSRVARNFPPRRGSINSSSRHQARKVTHMRLLACLAVIGLMSMGCRGPAGRADQMQTLPGGASASSAMSEVPIDVTDPPALDVKLQVDEKRAARRVISTQGGTITATGADGSISTLTIPENALLGDEEIILTPVTEMTGAPDGVTIAAGVQMAPDGLL